MNRVALVLVVCVLAAWLQRDARAATTQPAAQITVEEVGGVDGKAAVVGGDGRFKVTIAPREQSGARFFDVEVVNARGADAAANVYCQIPLPGEGWRFHPDPINNVAAAGQPAQQQHYPIAVATEGGSARGWAVAVAPATPCLFTAGCSKERGFYVQARVGFSDAADSLRRARITFVAYPIDGAWGMRSALAKYYALFPAAYERRATRDGLWIFHGKASATSNPDDFAYHSLGELGECHQHQKLAVDILTADEVVFEHRRGIEIYPYVIPGQREAGFQPTLKGAGGKTVAMAEGDEVRDFVGVHYSSAEAFAVLDSLTEKNLTISQRVGPLDAFKRTVRNSSLIGADGDVVTRPRTTRWSDLSLTFPTNPNPAIVGRAAGENVGTLILDQCRRWLDAGAWDGIYVDSLYRWGEYLNYRREHFPAARYGLTYGPDGRPCLSNRLEHLAFLDALGELVHPRGKKVFANGVRDTTFFHAHRLDMLGSEFGFGTKIEGLAYRRAIAYHKPYLGMYHGMGSAKKDSDYLARCFLFGLYGGGEGDYFASPAYQRDRPIYDMLLPVQREMTRLGWEPVTAARVRGEGGERGVLVERFGNGPTVYFSAYASQDGARETFDLELDTARLGLANVTATDAFSGRSIRQSAEGAIIVLHDLPLRAPGVAAVRVVSPAK